MSTRRRHLLLEFRDCSATLMNDVSGLGEPVEQAARAAMDVLTRGLAAESTEWMLIERGRDTQRGNMQVTTHVKEPAPDAVLVARVARG